MLCFRCKSEPDASLVLKHNAPRVVLDSRSGSSARLHGKGTQDSCQARDDRQLSEARTWNLRQSKKQNPAVATKPNHFLYEMCHRNRQKLYSTTILSNHPSSNKCFQLIIHLSDAVCKQIGSTRYLNFMAKCFANNENKYYKTMDRS